MISDSHTCTLDKFGLMSGVWITIAYVCIYGIDGVLKLWFNDFIIISPEQEYVFFTYKKNGESQHSPDLESYFLCSTGDVCSSRNL